VSGTNRRTTLGQPPLSVTLVEHALAALSGLRLDNCLVELDAPEPPGLDGSAHAFVHALRQAESVILDADRPVWTVDKPVIHATADATLALHPSEQPGLRISYLLDYGIESPIPWQISTITLTPESFTSQVAMSRTFLTEDEALALRRQGLGANTKVDDLLIFGRRGPIQNQLRFGNEPARHKILDIVGDLSLLGCDLAGHVVAYRSGHPHNIELVRMLAQAMQQGLPRRRMLAA
jgi:UDP-3-O-acyl-N-acetylglucosamine deacetylase